MASRWTNFQGSPCRHCGWGPTTLRTLSLNEEVNLDLGPTCQDCAVVIVTLSKNINYQESEAPVDEMLAQLLQRGFRFRYCLTGWCPENFQPNYNFPLANQTAPGLG